MTLHSRRLGGGAIPPPHSTDESSDPSVEAIDPDFFVILAALLCALICVTGLIAVGRCAWIRRVSSRNSLPPEANRGLKKKVLKTLPKLTYGEDKEQADKLFECAICLTEFAAGEQIRVLPPCGHGFHVVCIDTWLGSHSSCPSCRRILVVARCQKCGRLPSVPVSCGGGEAAEIPIETGGDGFFLP